MIVNPIYDALHSGDISRVREWIRVNPDDLNAPVTDGYSPLHIACAFGQEALVTYLLGCGSLINLNAMNASVATPLHLAVSFRDEDVACRISQQLIDFGAELNAPQMGGQTPLHHAVARGSEKLVELLVLAGADPFLKDEHGHSAVDIARQGSDAEKCERLRLLLKKAHSLVSD